MLGNQTKAVGAGHSLGCNFQGAAVKRQGNYSWEPVKSTLRAHAVVISVPGDVTLQCHLLVRERDKTLIPSPNGGRQKFLFRSNETKQPHLYKFNAF